MLTLEDLYNGKLKSQNVVIEDSFEAPGRYLVLSLLHSLCQRCDQVLLIACGRPPIFYVNALPAGLRHRVKLPGNLPKPARIGDRLPAGPLIAAVLRSIQGSNQSVGVVIDDTSTLVDTHSVYAVPQLVRSLLDYRERGNKVEQVVSSTLKDVYDERDCRIIRGRPTTFIDMQLPSSPRHAYGCIITHGEPFTEPTVHAEDFNISNDFIRVVDVTPVSKTAEVKSAAPEQQADPTANLTFNLSLKPEEKAAKDQVVLPYTLASSSDGQSGVIHYMPDDADDFDDEDPDDDLDF